MAKYLIQVQGGNDYISSKKGIRSLVKENEGKSFMVYNSFGLLEYFYDSKVRKPLNICDGCRRKFAVDYIKKNKVGTILGSNCEDEWWEKYNESPSKFIHKGKLYEGSRKEIRKRINELKLNLPQTSDEYWDVYNAENKFNELHLLVVNSSWRWYRDENGLFYTEGEFNDGCEKHYIPKEDDYTICY